jgi:hypothetical protein
MTGPVFSGTQREKTEIAEMLKSFHAAALAVGLISFGTVADAADAQFCRDYAHVAIRQAEDFFSSRACTRQDRDDGTWSTDFRHHYDWCLDASYREAGRERDGRAETLTRCL